MTPDDYLPFAFDGHPKVRLFIMSLGAGIILAVGMIIWSHRRRTKKLNQPVEKDARKVQLEDEGGTQGEATIAELVAEARALLGKGLA